MIGPVSISLSIILFLYGHLPPIFSLGMPLLLLSASPSISEARRTVTK